MKKFLEAKVEVVTFDQFALPGDLTPSYPEGD